ncbi:ATP-dependent DNA ligase [Candidimonas sp. SYP-B2681]|uniref:ATP-dependent DNA ligase n=1 Tax=Candidimonas sp. SYP-B2681 TaxID=2497686 RepID=UPI000F882462|nr:ATP-dependent DNA ligase [Candidimonas sp. SYP-B2681]RTZ44731.1 ATP-dependent DNA ligase [Candidimonas sp. SYP-B2681]
MKRFALLYQELDRSTATLDKRAALIGYFRDAPPRDAAWALYLLSGGKITSAKRKIATTSELREWIAATTGMTDWLVQESYYHVGDLAETLALLMPDPAAPMADIPLADWIENRLLPVANAAPSVRRETIVQAWTGLPLEQRLLFNKMLTGSLRVGVSKRLVQQALAELSGVDIARIAQRMMGEWLPSPTFLRNLLSSESLVTDSQQPYPFFLASPLEGHPATLGNTSGWLIEWKWDGIRLQILKRRTSIVLWSRGEERLDGRFPEIEAAAARLPQDCVLDAELLAWSHGEENPLPFAALQTRIQRLKPGPKILEAAPARAMAYDVLELNGEDLRLRPQIERRRLLEELLAAGPPDSPIRLSPCVTVADWDEAARLRAGVREQGVEGLMLKRLTAPYQAGRRRGDWWKWKIDPLTIDAVLLYAQPGHGRRSTLYTDYTFGLWDGDSLTPVAKAYSGLNDQEILELDRWIRAHTVERFGPVRAVEWQHVFELAFEAVNLSNRHKSGVALRFPRILRWRHDKPAAEADRLESLKALAGRPLAP